MAIVIGLVVAIAAVLLVLDPILRPGRAAAPAEPEEDPVERRKELALAALKEIEFDRATGKLSEADYQTMLVRYTKDAVEALREAEVPAGHVVAGGNAHAQPTAGVAAATASAADDPIERLIAEARQASNGRRFCVNCGAALEGSGRFCVECGARA